VGVTEKDVVVKQDCAICNRDVGVPEVVGKQDGAGNNRAYGVSEDEVDGKRDGSVTIGRRRWPQECQPCGLVEDKGRTPPVT